MGPEYFAKQIRAAQKREVKSFFFYFVGVKSVFEIDVNEVFDLEKL